MPGGYPAATPYPSLRDSRASSVPDPSDSQHEPVDACLHSTRGPGNLCRALAIRREHDNGRDLGGDDLFVEDAPRPRERIVSGRRVPPVFNGFALAAIALMFFLVTIVRLGANVANRPL